MTARDQTAMVGVGSTRYFRRGQSLPRTEMELFCQAVLAATDDAGISVDDIDGFACYSGHLDLGMVAQTLGLKELRFGASVTGSVYTFTVARHAVVPELRDSVPYVIAVISLEGAGDARLITNIVGCQPEEVEIEAAVQVVWDDLTDATTVPRFVLASG